MDAYTVFPWFFQYNIIFLIIFASITALVSLFSYKLYKLTGQNQLKLFSLAFLSFSIAYIANTVITLVMRSIFSIGIGRISFLDGATPLKVLINNVHAIFIILGLMLLVYMTLKVRNIKVMLLLFGVISISIIVTPQHLFLFHILAVFLICFIISHYYNNYTQNKQVQTFLVLIAFVFLLLGQLGLMLSFQRGVFFTTGRVFELIGYGCILTNLILVFNKKK